MCMAFFLLTACISFSLALYEQLCIANECLLPGECVTPSARKDTCSDVLTLHPHHDTHSSHTRAHGELTGETSHL